MSIHDYWSGRMYKKITKKKIKNKYQNQMVTTTAMVLWILIFMPVFCDVQYKKFYSLNTGRAVTYNFFLSESLKNAYYVI